MKETLIDIETYCEADIKKCGLYRYVSDLSFEILLIAWATDEGDGFGETKLADLASGDSFPQELLDDFEDSNVTLIAHNAAFERVSFSRYLQQYYPGQYLKPGAFLSPDNWICTMVMAASLTLPMALKDVGEVLRTTQQKDEEGKRLIKLFSAPCKPTKSNGGRTRNLPHHLPEDWAKFKYYCIQDVNTEVDIYKRLKRFPMPDREWHHYRVNERINDRGVRIDTELVLTPFGIRDLLEAVSDYAGEELAREIEEYIDTNVADIDDYEKEFDRLEQENERLADHYRGVLNDIREEVDALDTLLHDTRLNRTRMQGAVKIIRQMIHREL